MHQGLWKLALLLQDLSTSTLHYRNKL